MNRTDYIPDTKHGGCSLAEVAAEIGVTTERARQIEARALEKCRGIFKLMRVRSAGEICGPLDPPRYKAKGLR